MKQLTYIVWAIAIFLFACGTESMEQNIDSSIYQATTNVAGTVSLAKSKFSTSWAKITKSTNDPKVKHRIDNLYYSVVSTCNYIDSLRSEINKLEDKDTKNIETIKLIYLNQGAADTLFNKINSSLKLVQEVANSQETKLSIKNIGTNILVGPDVENFKKQYFTLNSPTGVSWILSGIETELLKAGTESLTFK